MQSFQPFHGTITIIRDFPVARNEELSGCYKLMTLVGDDGTIVTFVVSPSTYFVDHVQVTIGDKVTGYYDKNAAVPLIYPPQYRAIIMVKETPHQNTKVDYFDSQLVSSDGYLKLIVDQNTQIALPNNQAYTQNLANRNLIVVYDVATKSIPAQTTPIKIIIIC
ncbi:hypothetical protein AWH56_022415 [Anaerobacillus isosaccharinicus]|uniref:Uncharacterized protein n=1 Tax=Anaerobacillus isosaccharinicus TaxID=1532552 RepID=A0A1S2L5J6_9BACI|nr:hypothetical protein [Anaerobacillus isosaccharinicus]MBA5586343.1 hypothetical protein [Anaerobacillus isosaccharinicus]QOY35408.1 hypothetical protein AWH56_022415 [Anaerobacillus isosaccharinicus]